MIQKACHDVLNELGLHDPLLEVAIALEKVALEDDYFVKRRLYPNVDFYSGIILKAMGFPVSMFTALFAVGRTVGWIAQWNELIEDPSQKINRPRQLYRARPSAITSPSPTGDKAGGAYPHASSAKPSRRRAQVSSSGLS